MHSIASSAGATTPVRHLDPRAVAAGDAQHRAAGPCPAPDRLVRRGRRGHRRLRDRARRRRAAARAACRPAWTDLGAAGQRHRGRCAAGRDRGAAGGRPARRPSRARRRHRAGRTAGRRLPANPTSSPAIRSQRRPRRLRPRGVRRRADVHLRAAARALHRCAVVHRRGPRGGWRSSCCSRPRRSPRNRPRAAGARRRRNGDRAEARCARRRCERW